MHLDSLLILARSAAEKAAIKIMDVYDSGEFKTEMKLDESPLTQADRKSHHSILEILKPAGLPILSEEGKQIDYDVRRSWKTFWLIDPLDGTKEFIKRNGEFTVNIALIENHVPVLGVVCVPVTGSAYFAARGMGAFLKTGENIKPLDKRRSVNLDQPGLRVVASRSHMNEATEAFINKLDRPVLVSSGSSLKFLLVASGKADIYPRYAPTMEWDTAAAHAIVNEVGIGVYTTDRKSELTYNKADLLNPPFICI